MRYEHDHENDVIYFAKTNFRNKMQTFGIKTDDRRRHTYIIGKTGMGKTTLLENMVLSDIYAGHGCVYIDPHGDTSEKLLDYIPSWRINDVVYFNPSDLNNPVGFNILESVDEDMKHLVAAGMMGVFKKIWENVWSARMEYILNNTILALLDTPGTTLLGINRMLSDADYRKQIVGNVKDPIVKQFWVKEFESYQSKFATEAVAPIQNKVGQFLSAAIIRNIVAQAKSTLDMRKIMDDQMIFIVNLSKGRIGEDASRLLGGMIITKIQMSAMERVDMAEEDRQDFYMYVDEFQNFAVESFASILSEARKYRLNLIMAHQYIAQLTEEVRDAVFGNVGTIISFRVGSPDAQFMEDEFMPRFTPEDIINLPKYSIYLKLMIDGVTSMPFSATTLPPIAIQTNSAQKVVEQSRERYGGSREKIEEHVAIWSGFGDDVDLDTEYKASKDAKKAAKKEKYLHEYDCTRCKDTFSIPVELDRSRPIYCETCKPIIDTERQKRKEKGGSHSAEATRDRSHGGSGQSREKKVVTTPPKVKDGELVGKETGKSMSLDALKKKDSDSPPFEGGARGGSESAKTDQGGSKGESDAKARPISSVKELKEEKAGALLRNEPIVDKKDSKIGAAIGSEAFAQARRDHSADQGGSDVGARSETSPVNTASPVANVKDTSDQQPIKRKRKRRSRNKKDGEIRADRAADQGGSKDTSPVKESREEKASAQLKNEPVVEKKDSKIRADRPADQGGSKEVVEKKVDDKDTRVAPGQVISFDD